MHITVERTVANKCLPPTRPPVAATTSFRRGGGEKRTISPLFGLAPTFDDTFSTRRRSDEQQRTGFEVVSALSFVSALVDFPDTVTTELT